MAGSAVLEYGSVNISTYCDKIAYDQTCWMLRACTGKCKLPGGDKKGKGRWTRWSKVAMNDLLRPLCHIYAAHRSDVDHIYASVRRSSMCHRF